MPREAWCAVWGPCVPFRRRCGQMCGAGALCAFSSQVQGSIPCRGCGGWPPHSASRRRWASQTCPPRAPVGGCSVAWRLRHAVPRIRSFMWGRGGLCALCALCDVFCCPAQVWKRRGTQACVPPQAAPSLYPSAPPSLQRALARPRWSALQDGAPAKPEKSGPHVSDLDYAVSDPRSRRDRPPITP